MRYKALDVDDCTTSSLIERSAPTNRDETELVKNAGNNASAVSLSLLYYSIPKLSESSVVYTQQS